MGDPDLEHMTSALVEQQGRAISGRGCPEKEGGPVSSLTHGAGPWLLPGDTTSPQGQGLYRPQGCRSR